MPNYQGQNYKVNRKVKEDVDKNQVNYVESAETPISTIKRIYLYVVDKKGRTIPEATILVDGMTIKTGYGGILISNFPNKTATITAKKTGYKDGTAKIREDEPHQEFTFTLVLEDDEGESTVTEKETDDITATFIIKLKNENVEGVTVSTRPSGYQNPHYMRQGITNAQGKAVLELQKPYRYDVDIISDEEVIYSTTYDIEEDNETITINLPETYYFKSYSDSNKTEVLGIGSVKTTNVEENGYSQVEVITNNTNQSFIGQKFYVISNAQTNGTLYQLYTDAGTTGTGMYVEISDSPLSHPNVPYRLELTANRETFEPGDIIATTVKIFDDEENLVSGDLENNLIIMSEQTADEFTIASIPGSEYNLNFSTESVNTDITITAYIENTELSESITVTKLEENTPEE